MFEPEEEFQVHLGTPLGDHWSGAMVGASDIVTITITNDEDGRQEARTLTANRDVALNTIQSLTCSSHQRAALWVFLFLTFSLFLSSHH